MTHTAHVELHGVRVQAHRDGPVLQQPLRHLRLVLGDLNAARHARYHSRPIKMLNTFYMSRSSHLRLVLGDFNAARHVRYH
jgi:hypothetical protein